MSNIDVVIEFMPIFICLLSKDFEFLVVLVYHAVAELVSIGGAMK